MPEISSIEKQKKSDQRFNVFIDGEFAFATSAETIFKEQLASGKNIDETTINRLTSENEVGLVFDKTLNWISSRPHSEKEVIDYLHKYNPKAKKPKSERAISLVISRLKKLGYINDEVFAVWYIESRNRSRPRGRKLLGLELRSKGIDREIIEKVNQPANEYGDNPGEQSQSETDLALRVAEKKLQSYRNLNSLAFRQKMSALLARRGFDWETITEVIDQLLKKR